MALIACLLLVSATKPTPTPTLPWGADDFVQYYVALDLLFEGKNPYDQGLATIRQKAYGRHVGVQMLAPPWALLPSLLVSGLPFQLATYGYIVLNATLLIFCVVCWTLLLFPGRWSYLPTILFAFCLWLPTQNVLACGQNSLWPLAGFTGWLWFTSRKQTIPAGLFLALTILIKPHLGLLPCLFASVYSLRQQKWSTIATFALSMVAATILTFCLRPTIWSEYLMALKTGISPSNLHTYTLSGMLRSFQIPLLVGISYALWIAALLFIAISTWKIFKPEPNLLPGLLNSTQNHSLIVWSVYVCMMVLPLVIYAWLFDFVFMLPGMVAALGFWLGDQRGGRLCLFLWLLMDLWIRLFSYEPGYWIVPWIGMVATMLLMRSHPIQDMRPDVKTLPISAATP